MNLRRCAYFSAAALCLMFAGCVAKVAVQPLSGALEAPLVEDTLPAHVRQALAEAKLYHQYEIMSDEAEGISVSAIGEADNHPTDGFGIVVVRNATSVTFPHIRNSRQPNALYDSASGDLWLSTSAMEGSGVEVQRLYRLRFRGDSAYIAAVAEPYAVQQEALAHLGYSLDGSRITFYVDGASVSTVTNTVTDQGEMAADALWIGESMTYALTVGGPHVCITPGLRFASGPVFYYDDMPTFTPSIAVGDDGSVTLSEWGCNDPAPRD